MSTASSNRPRSSGAASRPSSRVNKPAVPVQSRPTSRNVPPSSGGGNHNPTSMGDNSKRQIVGQYMLGKTIGEGTFGKVKLAVHMPTGEKVRRRRCNIFQISS